MAAASEFLQDRGGIKMKITISSKYTTIEADVKELRESNTLAGCFGNILRRAFQSTEPLDDEEEEEGEEETE